MESEDTYRPRRDWIARTLLLFLILFIIGAALCATLGAALAPIPLIGLVAMLLAPFPTLTLYFGATTILYLLAMIPARLSGGEPGWMRWAVLAVAMLLPWLGGWSYAEMANRRAGVSADALAQPGWSPLHFASADTIAMVESGTAYGKAECDAICLSLLVTGDAREVIVAVTEPKIDRGVSLPGTAFSLKPDWRACMAQLPDYLSIVRSASRDRPQYLIDFGLNPFFAGAVQACLAQRSVRFVAGGLPTLFTLRAEGAKFDESGGLGWQLPYAEQHIFMPGGRDDNRRFSRLGYRYAVPATIWPYGGNAGTGGTFSPVLTKVMVSAESISALDGPAWWDMVAEPRALALRTTAILDRVVPDRSCQPQPGPCVPR